jgi:hypothetical protein
MIGGGKSMWSQRSRWPTTIGQRLGEGNTFKVVVDRGAKRVVGSNSGKCTVDSARRGELGSLDEMRKSGDTDSGNEISRISIFR